MVSISASSSTRRAPVPIIQILQLTGLAMANATYEFMRANATEEMRRVLGAKAANVQLAVPPTLAAGDWSVDSEGDGEGSSGDLHDGVSESDNNN